MKISIKAILLGYLIGFLGSAVESAIEVFLYTRYSVSEIQPFYPYFSIVVQVILKFIGGYSAARIAKKNEILHGAILGFITWFLSLLITVFVIRRYNPAAPLIDLTSIGQLLLCIFSCVLGAFVYKKIKEKKESEAESPLEQKIENLGNN